MLYPEHYTCLSENEQVYTCGGDGNDSPVAVACAIAGACLSMVSALPVSYTHLTLPTTERV